jgi:hypothetical protein
MSLSLLLWLSMIAIATDGSGTVRLGIEAVDSDLQYFDITMEPGESRELTVRFSNHGEIGTGASVFAADVYSLHGGGMGMADIDAPRTGATEWLDLESTELELEPGESIDQVFTVAVPDDVEPGDYITAVVIQNTDPIGVGDDDDRFDQTVRQGIAVAIDVPGERQPELEFGEVRHSTMAGSSVIEVELQNTGNAHLRPAGIFDLRDADGVEIAATPIELDTIFAGTGTVIEVTLTGELPTGDYVIRLDVDDEGTGATASADDLVFSISSPEPTPEPDEGLAGAVDSAEEGITRDPGTTALIAGALAVVGILLLAAIAIFVRSRRTASPEPEPVTASQSPSSETAPSSSTKRGGAPPPIRQITPPGRNHSPDS